MAPVRKSICKRIKDLRKRHHYRQGEVAEKLNMSQNSYSELESGKRKIDVERLYDIAKLYKVPVATILEELPPPPLRNRI